MKKGTLKVFLLPILLLVLLSCSPISLDVPSGLPSESKNAGIRAVYLVHGSGQLSKNDLADHLEILVVYTFMELQDIAATHVVDIWIDKNAVELVDSDWLYQEPQKYYPLVLIGFNDPLYSFREQLTGFGIEGSEINWDTNSLEPDFSIWILKAESEFSSSAFIKVYPEEATVQSILNITNVHLKVPFWTTN